MRSYCRADAPLARAASVLVRGWLLLGAAVLLAGAPLAAAAASQVAPAAARTDAAVGSATEAPTDAAKSVAKDVTKDVTKNPAKDAAVDTAVEPAVDNARAAADRAAPPSAAAIDAALKALRADPNLAADRIERKLAFKRGDARKPRDLSSIERWLGEFFRWLGEAGRFVMWVLGAIGIGLLLWFIARALAQRGSAGAARLDLPSHVGKLDIRPDSLPDDVGAAVWDLWLRGELRAALSLLYRGALSRLVHDFAVPIKAASTEGECVALAQQHAPRPAAALFADLVGVWQPAVYGARMPAASTVQRLCSEFSAVLAAPTAAASARMPARQGAP